MDSGKAFMAAQASQRMCHGGARDLSATASRVVAPVPCTRGDVPKTKGPLERALPGARRRRTALRFRRGLDPWVVLEERLVQLDEALPLVRRLVLGEDRLHRTHRLTRPAVDALVGMDEELRVALVNAIDGAHLHAGLVLDVDAGFSDHIRHLGPPDVVRAPARLFACGTCHM